MNKEDCRKSSLYVACGCMPAKVAEGEGFKPPIPERGIPDFESSAFDHSANFPLSFCGCKVNNFSRYHQRIYGKLAKIIQK